MTRQKKFFFILFFSLISSFVTYKFCRFIAEKYFFDKFFYEKSIDHGYRNFDERIPLFAYGERSFGLRLLLGENTGDDSILNQNNQKFKIIIIGDSYIWGQGLRNSERFSSLLQTKLSQVKPTQIISVNKSGWNILDFLSAYQKIIKMYSPDLIIFSLINNDIFISKTDTDNEIVKKCTALYPELTTTYDFDPILFTGKNDLPENEKPYYKITTEAWKNPINLCILNSSLKLLPTFNTIYFIPDDYSNESEFYQTYKKQLSNQNKYILTSENGQKLNKYRKYWKDSPWNHFLISTSEKHPNALANQMYTDILYQEITINPQWGF